MTQDELFDALEDEREKFLDVIDGLPEEAIIEAGVVGDWSIKDIMAHISQWEAELVKLLWQAASGQTPTTIHFTQVSVDETNAAWNKQSKTRPLIRIEEDFRGVRAQTIRRLQVFSDQVLNDPQAFPWLGGRLLWEWVAGDSFEHEAEHSAEIRAWRDRKGI